MVAAPEEGAWLHLCDARGRSYDGGLSSGTPPEIKTGDQFSSDQSSLSCVCVCVSVTDHVHVKQRDPLSFQVFTEAGLGGWDWLLVALPVLCFHGNTSAAGGQRLREVKVHPNAISSKSTS